MKKTLSLLIVGILILTGLGASATPLVDTSSNIKWQKIENNSPLFLDELDQEQTDMDWFGPIGSCPLVSGVPNYVIAQSFIPTKNVLTKVELMLGKNITTTYDCTVAIRADLSGEDLTSVSIHAADVTTENFSWEEFDFVDLAVTPGNTYYIVSSTVNATDNWYAWGLKMNGTAYPTGTIYYSIDDQVTWTEEPGGDMTFKTYGVDNQPPGIPTIDGEINGKVGVSYDYTIMSTDPDGDQVYYWIEWFEGCPGVNWEGPYNSGDNVIIPHTWDSKGTFLIKVKAKDIYNAESDWATLEVTMPRARSGKILLLNFLERFPNAFPLLRYLLKL